MGNLFALFLFGPRVERVYGGFILVSLFIVAGALANHVAMLLMHDPSRGVIGVSGAISAMLGISAIDSHRGQLRYSLIPFRILAVFWLLLQFIFAVGGYGAGLIAWPAHIAGFGIGVAFGFALIVAKRNHAVADRVRRFASRYG